MLRRIRPEIPLFVLVFGVYAYFYQAGGWNENSRFALTRSIVEHGTFAIDAFHESTGDKARRGEHWYSDKAPGLSWLAVPVYAAVHALRPRAVVVGSYLATVLAVGLPSALAAVQLLAVGRVLGLAASWAAAIAAAYALGTLALPYSTTFYGHQLSAALGLGAFALVCRRRRPVLAGVLLGLAVCVDYTSAILALAVTACAAVRLGAGGAARVAAGGLPAALALFAYHAAAFGHPLALPYDYVMQDHRRMGWFMGIDRPDLRVAWALLGGPYRGLFYGAPWLLAGLPGLAVLYRRGHRPEAAVCGGVFLAYLLVNASLADWAGGWAMGPRYLIPAIPFLAVGAMGLVTAWPPASTARRALAGVGGAAAAFSAALMLMGTAVRPDVPLTIRRPFQQYLVPSFRHGRVARSNHPIDGEGISGRRAAWNLGHVAGLDRLATLVPLALWAGVTGAWLAWAAAGADRGRERES
ncbi:MAG TPA: hypothetical protein VMR21_16875 [Vicinamibacteria bacterium]|nr:hypothetical protein [Vicinamibacteria bacterium]